MLLGKSRAMAGSIIMYNWKYLKNFQGDSIIRLSSRLGKKFVIAMDTLGVGASDLLPEMVYCEDGSLCQR